MSEEIEDRFLRWIDGQIEIDRKLGYTPRVAALEQCRQTHIDWNKLKIVQLEERLRDAEVVKESHSRVIKKLMGDADTLAASNTEYRKMLSEVAEFLESKDYLAFAEDIFALLEKHTEPSKPTQ